MSILTGEDIRQRRIITPHKPRTVKNGMSYGESLAGYDIRLGTDVFQLEPGEFYLASSREHFNLPKNVIGFVKDKSTWARQGLSVFNTVIEPGWRGFLTLELKNQSVHTTLHMRPNMPIAQVIFMYLTREVEGYEGKYQDQERGPQRARFE